MYLIIITIIITIIIIIDIHDLKRWHKGLMTSPLAEMA